MFATLFKPQRVEGDVIVSIVCQQDQPLLGCESQLVGIRYAEADCIPCGHDSESTASHHPDEREADILVSEEVG